ncbi:MAG: DUF4249 family protein [Bacteroidaceae bacterium]|nr:DUF4249 family protein [Bacteroidaceae bacterium]
MRIKNSIILLMIVLLGTSCERTLDFVTGDEGMGNMTIGAIAVTGSPLTVYINQAISVDKAQLAEYIGIGEDRIRYMQAGESIDYMQDTYFKKSAVKDAQVSAEVNGQQTYTLTFDESSYGYTCDYVPKEGDRIVVKAAAGGQELHSETVVPQKPKIEILSHEVLAENPYREVEGYMFRTDTIMRITCRIIKQQGQQYYRLRVRSERDVHGISGYIGEDGKPVFVEKNYYAYQMQDVYFSDDEIFVDKRLTRGFGGWKPYFSNVFDDSLVSTGGYTFTVDSPKMPRILSGVMSSASNSQNTPLPPQVMIELQTISPELYNYLKSVELYHLTYNDAYAEPVQIYSNVQNGWGIFGALSYDRHFVEFGE